MTSAQEFTPGKGWFPSPSPVGTTESCVQGGDSVVPTGLGKRNGNVGFPARNGWAEVNHPYGMRAKEDPLVLPFISSVTYFAYLLGP